MRDDELDAELRRIFADDRLNLPVAEDAESRVFLGITRRRRRRGVALAVTGAMVTAALVIGGVAIAPGGLVGRQDRAEPPVQPPSLSTSAPQESTTRDPSGGPTTPPARGTAAPTGESDESDVDGTRRPPEEPGGDAAPTSSADDPAPTTATPAPPPISPPGGGAITPGGFGPDGYGGYGFGTDYETIRDELSKGSTLSPSNCPTYGLNGVPGVFLTFSPEKKLVEVMSRQPGSPTRQGIDIDATNAEVRAAYPEVTQESDNVLVAPEPDNADAKYRFLFENGKLVRMELRLTSSPC